MENLDERQGRRALVTLARAAQELEAAAEILLRLMPMIGTIPAPRETLVALYEALPFPTLVLAEARSLLARRILDSTPLDAEPRERARWLTASGENSANLGRHDDGLSDAEEAVTIYRRLAEADPETYRLYEAFTLSHLGIRLAELGRRTDALLAEEEALVIHQEMAEIDPGHHRPDLARSLSNLGVRLTDVGRFADALLAEEEALAIRRELAETSPDLYRLDLAGSLTNVGLTLVQLKRWDEALVLVRKGTDLWQELADRDPRRFAANYDGSIRLLKSLTGDKGDPAADSG